MVYSFYVILKVILKNQTQSQCVQQVQGNIEVLVTALLPAQLNISMQAALQEYAWIVILQPALHIDSAFVLYSLGNFKKNGSGSHTNGYWY